MRMQKIKKTLSAIIFHNLLFCKNKKIMRRRLISVS